MPETKTHIPTFKYTQMRVYIRELVPGKSSKALNERGRRLTRVDWRLWGRWFAGKRGKAQVPVGSPGAIHMPYTSSSMIWFLGYCNEVEIWELEGSDQRKLRGCGKDLMHFSNRKKEWCTHFSWISTFTRAHFFFTIFSTSLSSSSSYFSCFFFLFSFFFCIFLVEKMFVGADVT